jgi:RimJ/RimL family protein N-acetyltransferase
VPAPTETESYISAALEGQRAGTMLPWAVRELESGAVVGTTRYHDIVLPVERVEIGYTFYARSWQHTHLNTACKLLLMEHAFDTLGCKVVGLRTDNFNFASQKAIAALGAKRDGVLRHHQLRKDGTVRDSVMFSILLAEWPDVRRHLALRLSRLRDGVKG